MIKILNKIPKSVGLAFSGGVDSLAVAHFLARSGRDVTLLHFNHKCEYSEAIEQQCSVLASVLGLAIGHDFLEHPMPPKGVSLESHWRDARYKFLRSYAKPVITCHHLDDAVETWVWSALHGKPTVIPYENDGIIRPFLLNEKQKFIDYAVKHNLPVVDDPYNREMHLTRNYIRSNLLPHAYYVNPGLRKVIKKKYL